MRDGWYHLSLRTAAAVLALTLLFVSGVVLPYTAELSRNSASYLATAVGVGATVAPNELNVITAQLTARERELAQREATLAQRELQTGVGREQSFVGETDVATYILSTILFILLVLILLNYALDFRRSQVVVGETTHRQPLVYTPRRLQKQ